MYNARPATLLAETRAHERMRRGQRWEAHLLAVILLPALAAAACRSRGRQSVERHPKTPAIDERPYLLETVGEFAVSRLYADGFDELSPRERVLAFYLHRASLAGR